MMTKTAQVLGAGGSIGEPLVRQLKALGKWVRGVNLDFSPFAERQANYFAIEDLRDPYFCRQVIDRRIDCAYQFAADRSSAGYKFTGNS